MRLVYLVSSRYEELKEIGADIICDAEITEYPFDVFEVAKKLEVEVVDYQSLPDTGKDICFNESEDGFSMLYKKNGKKQWRIYYNAEMNTERIRFTIMHEIAHVSANHGYGNEVEESEANFLASFVLAPPCIIHEKKVEDYIDLSREFGVSNEMSYHQFHKYNKWLECGGDYYKDYEERILQLYKGENK